MGSGHGSNKVLNAFHCYISTRWFTYRDGLTWRANLTRLRDFQTVGKTSFLGISASMRLKENGIETTNLSKKPTLLQWYWHLLSGRGPVIHLSLSLVSGWWCCFGWLWTQLSWWEEVTRGGPWSLYPPTFSSSGLLCLLRGSQGREELQYTLPPVQTRTLQLPCLLCHDGQNCDLLKTGAKASLFSIKLLSGIFVTLLNNWYNPVRTKKCQGQTHSFAFLLLSPFFSFLSSLPLILPSLGPERWVSC